MTRWRITGTELADPLRGRTADVAWVDGTGLVAAPGSQWLLDELAALNGREVPVDPVTPIHVDLSDPASAYWATTSVLWHYDVEGDTPGPTWVDTTPVGAVN